MPERELNDRRLRGLVAVVVLASLSALSVLTGASWATRASSAGQGQYGGKVTICHHTHSKKNPWVTITVSQAALKAHLKQGDTLGACPTSGRGAKTTTTTATSTATTAPTHNHGQQNQGGGVLPPS